MPRTAVRVGLPVGRLCQRQMGGLAILECRRSIDGGPHQRMPEGHAIAEYQESARLPVNPRDRDPHLLGSTPQKQRIADGLRRREQQETPRVDGERIESSNEALLDSPREGLRIDQAETSGQLRRRQSARQFEQGKRIPTCLDNDPVAHLLVQCESHCRAQQRARIAVAHSAYLEIGHVLKLFARLARGEHDSDRLRKQATCDEGQRHR